MKKWIFFWGLIALPFWLFAANENDAKQLFYSANKAYEAGNFEEALSIYDSIAKAHTSFELHFNAGNAAFRAGKLGKSIVHYERAKRIAPNNDDLLVNLAIANARVVDRITELPSLGVEDLWGSLTSTNHLQTWAWVALFFQFLGFGLTAGWLFVRTAAIKRTLLALGITCIFLGAAAYGMSRATYNRVQAATAGVIMDAKVEVKNSPGSNDANAFILHEGTKVKLQQQLGDWYEIQIANGSVGWVQARAIEII